MFCFFLQSVVITALGTNEQPWQLTASIRPGTGHPDAVLSGALQVNSSNGWFNFTDLAISHMGSDYILDFNVTYPQVAENFTLSSNPFNVAGRPLRAHVVTKTGGDIVRSAGFSVGLDLRDVQTGNIITDIGWRVCVVSFVLQMTLGSAVAQWLSGRVLYSRRGAPSSSLSGITALCP